MSRTPLQRTTLPTIDDDETQDDTRRHQGTDENENSDDDLLDYMKAEEPTQNA